MIGSNRGGFVEKREENHAKPIVWRFSLHEIASYRERLSVWCLERARGFFLMM